jgi:GGDEF domain-containing protein
MATTARAGGKKKKKKEYSFKFLNRFMLIQFVLVLALCIFITVMVSNRAKENANNNIMTIRRERLQMVENFAKNAETILDSFSKAPEIQKFLENPSDSTLKKTVQEYNSAFAASIDGLEGLYVCDWNSKTLTHSTLSTVGKVIREGERLNDLHTHLTASGSDVYTSGMVLSPTTGAMVLSLYKAIPPSSGSGTPVGFVGFAVDTSSLREQLKEVKTEGMDTAIYGLIDCSTEPPTYIFADDADAGSPVVIPDVINTINDVRSGSVPNEDIYEYKLPGNPTFVGTYEYTSRRQWLLMFNAESREVYSLRNAMRMFMGVFTILMVALMALFTYLNRKQERVNERLLTSMEKVKETRASLNSAMYNDILTDVGNRIKFAIDIDGSDGRNNPYYFAMFNLIELSNINTQFGNDSGDSLLVRTANILKEKFEASTIYRTGSDEFVVVFQTVGGTPRQESIIDSVNDVLRNLVQPETIQGLGTIYPKYSVAVIKKTTDIDSSVITIMKEMTKMKGEAVLGMIDFSDLSETSAY